MQARVPGHLPPLWPGKDPTASLGSALSSTRVPFTSGYRKVEWGPVSWSLGNPEAERSPAIAYGFGELDPSGRSDHWEDGVFTKHSLQT